MKIGIFADSHYSSAALSNGNRYNNKSLAKINLAMSHFEKEKCDLVICLGDLIDTEDCHQKEIDNLKEIARDLSKYNLKTYIVMGNHDAFDFDVDEFYGILGEQHRPQNISSGDQNLIFIDACYFKSGKHYQPGDSGWTDTFFPETKALSSLLETITGDTYIFMHQNIGPEVREDHRLFNDEEVREILEKSGKVKTVYQGHFHPGNESVHNGIRYVTYPAMCEKDDAYYIIEL